MGEPERVLAGCCCCCYYYDDDDLACWYLDEETKTQYNQYGRTIIDALEHRCRKKLRIHYRYTSSYRELVPSALSRSLVMLHGPCFAAPRMLVYFECHQCMSRQKKTSENTKHKIRNACLIILASIYHVDGQIARSIEYVYAWKENISTSSSCDVLSNHFHVASVSSTPCIMIHHASGIRYQIHSQISNLGGDACT
jgi:hypothetical protein